MAVTALQVVQRVCRNVGLDPTITAFAESDESSDVLQYVNEAYEELLMQLPAECPYLNSSGTLTLVNGTRIYSLASNAQAFDLYDWSLIDTTNSYNQLVVATKEYVESLNTQYRTSTGKPHYVYPEGNQQVGFYPVPDAAATIQYEYGISAPARVSTTTATFGIPDRWMLYVEASAQEKYERKKGYGDPDATGLRVFNLLAEIQVEAWETNPTYFVSEGLS